ncbi:hypothetical protein HX001_10155 [Empedobacter brevis]|uniref:DUF7683 domain-containing protein n=1 Tax=Empedobacter brevis TaxID=247 RepID=A0AAJ1QF22_9FLAO|nr:hypothetical protein [Empedobacter brevis]MDM1072850.1 hypothetical protein [Empedobacter brevis]
MKIVRYIEEFNNSNDKLNNEYILDITPEKILEVLQDFKLNNDDYPNEIYDSYLLTILQLNRLKPFLKDKLEENILKYSYYLSAYEDNR